MSKTVRVLLFTFVLCCFTLPSFAQDATSEATPEGDAAATAEAPAGEATADANAGAGEGGASISAVDQLSLDGTVTVTNISAAGPAFVAIHADVGGLPGPVVGIAPVSEGETDSLQVLIDAGGATPILHAMLHTDDNTVGAFEFERIPGADLPFMNGDQMVMATFGLTAIRGFDQQAGAGQVMVASAISANGGWLVIHADEGGAPGPVLGVAGLRPGTNPNIIVPLTEGEATQVVFPMLHVDDTTVGEYEFGQVEGADAPIVVDGTVATTPINLTEGPVVVNAAGLPLATEGEQPPALFASPQVVEGVGAVYEAGMDPMSVMSSMTVDTVFSVGPGFIDVHADAMGHPGPSLGMAPVPDGQSEGVAVELMPGMMNANTPVPVMITPLVWPMLHTDDNEIGVYEYMMIPGADLPVVANGMVVSLPTQIGDPAMMGMATAEATMEGMDMMATAEATMEGMDMEATAEATAGS